MVILTAVLIGLAAWALDSRSPYGQDDLRLATFNVRNSTMDPSGERAWAQRRPVARRMLLGLDADILGLQEVTSEQRRNLDEDLVGYRGFGQGRDGNGSGEQCPIYSQGSLTVEDHGVFWLSPTPLRPSKGWDASVPRICTWVRYPGLTVFNTHLDYAGPVSRRKSLQLIRRHSKGSVVIMGDFNDHEGAPALEPVDDLVDAFRSIHPRVELAGGQRVIQNVTTYTAFKKGTARGPRLDFIFVSPDLEPLEARIITSHSQVLPSDHRALFVHLRRRR